MMETIGAIALAVLTTLSGVMTERSEITTFEVRSGYEQEAEEKFNEVTENVNEMFSEENKEELGKRGVKIQSVTAHYEQTGNRDSIYEFRVDVGVNEHTVTEILVIDLKDDEELEYYGLVDNELLTPEQTEYYQNLLSVQ